MEWGRTFSSGLRLTAIRRYSTIGGPRLYTHPESLMSDSNPFEPVRNPYTTPADLGGQTVYSGGEYREGEELAGRFTRFAAAMVDGIIIMAFILPVQYYSGFLQRAQTQSLGVVEQLVMSVFGFAVVMLINGYPLAKRGQTIGKMLTKIQIVDNNSTHLVSLATIIIFRYCWILPFTLLVIFIPGQLDDLLVQALTLIDALLIFGSQRRCLHDLIAGTRVLTYQPYRTQA